MRPVILLVPLLLAGCGGTRPLPAPPTAPPPTPIPEPVQPAATPAPGGGALSYPPGTVFATGTVDVIIGPGGRYTPAHVYLRPGATTTLHNRDTVPHRFDGFGGATSRHDPIPPGGTLVKEWHHPGTWTFHDSAQPQAPVFTVTDVPEGA